MVAKFLVTILLICVVWFGFRYAQRLGEIRRRPGKPPAVGVQDLVECPVCRTWRTPKACGRADCPY